MIDPTILTVASGLYLADPVSLDLRQVECVAEAVYWESRSQPLAAQVAVASTVLNRGRPCEVIRQPNQFSYRSRRSLKRDDARAWDTAVEVAVLTSSGAVQRYDATHFHDTSASPRWTKVMEFIGQAGKMKFWRDRK